LFRGASKVYSVDRVPQRLAKAKSIGAIPIDFTNGDPVAQILKLEPDGVDRSCDCVGYECVNAEGVNIGNTVIVQAVSAQPTIFEARLVQEIVLNTSVPRLMSQELVVALA